MFLHGREGGVAVFTFEDDDGLPRNMTNATVTFETSNGFTKTLVPGESGNKLNLVINANDLSVTPRSAEYVIIDRSGIVPQRILSGKLTVVGWD